MVDVEKLGVIGVEILADVGVDAGGTFALVAKVEVLAMHGIHIGRGTSEVTEVSFEVRELGDGLDFAEDAFFAARGDELTLMGGDSAEGTSAEASAMEAYGEFYCLIGRDTLASVFGMWQTSVRKVEGMVEFVLGEGLVRRVDHSVATIDFLDDALCGVFVGFFFDVAEILGLCPFVAEALFMTMQENVIRTDASRNVFFLQQGDSLFLWKARHEVAEEFHVYFAVLFYQKVCQ